MLYWLPCSHIPCTAACILALSGAASWPFFHSQLLFFSCQEQQHTTITNKPLHPSAGSHFQVRVVGIKSMDCWIQREGTAQESVPIFHMGSTKLLKHNSSSFQLVWLRLGICWLEWPPTAFPYCCIKGYLGTVHRHLWSWRKPVLIQDQWFTCW